MICCLAHPQKHPSAICKSRVYTEQNRPPFIPMKISSYFFRTTCQHGILQVADEFVLEDERGHTSRLDSAFAFCCPECSDAYEASQGSFYKQIYPQFVKSRVIT